MKAVVCIKYGSSDVLQLKEVEKPVPRDNEVLIKIHAATVNASDPMVRSGAQFMSRLFTGIVRPKNPIPGELSMTAAHIWGGFSNLFDGGPIFHNAEFFGLPTMLFDWIFCFQLKMEMVFKQTRV